MNMNNEVLQVDDLMDDKELDYQIALQCAPLLTGIKISNLLIVHRSKRNAVIRRFKKTALSYFVLCSTDQKITFLLYHKEKLLNYLAQDASREILRLTGYHREDLNVILKELSVRYGSYIKYRQAFPHEIGIFLGYPVEDVVGFINNQGKNYLYIGYWKVYGNLTEAMHLFEKYKQAKQLVIQMVSQGVNVHYIIENSYSM